MPYHNWNMLLYLTQILLKFFSFLDFDQKLTLFRVGSVGSDVVVVVVVFVVGSIDPQQRGNDGQKDERETK